MNNFANNNMNKKNLNAKDLMKKMKKKYNNDNKEIEKYKKFLYQECVEKIDKNFQIGKTDIFFKVPSTHNKIKNYNSLECLNFIQHNLRKNNFFTFIEENENMIFITWKYLKDT